MRKNVMLVAALAASMGVTMTSCEKNEPAGADCCAKSELKSSAKAEMVVHAEIAGAGHTRAFTEKARWESGDKLGIFVINQNDGSLFQGTQENMPYTFGPTGWSGSIVNISDVLPRVCGYHPHSASSNNLKEVAFEKGTDFLYSAPVTPVVAMGKADVRMKMKHALTQFRFKMSKAPGYRGQGAVTSLKVVKNSGTMFTSGKMDLLTGTFTGVGAVNEYSYVPNANITSNTIFGDAVMPSKGDFTLQLVIDNRPYSCPLGSCDWKSGKKYTYTFTLNQTELSLGDGDSGKDKGQAITIEEWGSENEKPINITPVA